MSAKAFFFRMSTVRRPYYFRTNTVQLPYGDRTGPVVCYMFMIYVLCYMNMFMYYDI